MSFCRITGRSRNLPKSHYFPLVPFESAASNQSTPRFCRITGKSIGQPTHHYIPILPKKSPLVVRCKVTTHAEPCPHQMLHNYKYIRPVLNDTNDTNVALKSLMRVLNGKIGDGHFVYTVDENKHGLVLPASLELAVRHGDVHDVMLAKKLDKILLRLKDGESVSLDVNALSSDDIHKLQGQMFEGEGVCHDHKHTPTPQPQTTALITVDDNVLATVRQALQQNNDGGHTFEENARTNTRASWTSAINSKKPRQLEHEVVAFDSLQKALEQIRDDIRLESTANIFRKLLENNYDKLPILSEVERVVDQLTNASPGNLNTIAGHGLYLSDAQRSVFVVGQTVETLDGHDMFVPGETIRHEGSLRFVPGITVNTSDGPAFIPGVVVTGAANTSNVFVPGNGDGGGGFELGYHMILCEMLDTDVPAEVKQRVKIDQRLDVSEEQLVALQNYLHDTHSVSASTDVCRVILAVAHLSRKLARATQFAIDRIPDQTFEKLLMDCVTLVQNHPVIDHDELNKFIYAHLGDNFDLNNYQTIILDVLVEYGYDDDDDEHEANGNAMKDMCRRDHDDDVYEVDMDVVHERIEAHFGAGVQADTMVDVASSLIYLAKNIACNHILGDVSSIAAAAAGNNTNDDQKIIAALLTQLVQLFQTQPDIELAQLLTIICDRVDNVKIDQSLRNTLIDMYDKLPSKVQLLERAVNLSKIRAVDPTLVIENIANVLDEPVLYEMFRQMCSSGGERGARVLASTLDKIQQQNVTQMPPDQVSQALGLIVSDVLDAENDRQLLAQETSTEQSLFHVDNDHICEIASAFAAAMNLTQVLDQLKQIDSFDSIKQNNDAVWDVLKRAFVMHNMAAINPAKYKDALQNLRKNANLQSTRDDAKVRQLVRDSAILMKARKSNTTTTTTTIVEMPPVSLLIDSSTNCLALEDYLSRSRAPRTLLIVRGSFQMVWPREASRAILNGTVPYTLIDHTGITHFKPMHMVSALGLSRNTVERLGMYKCLDGLVKHMQPAHCHSTAHVFV